MVETVQQYWPKGRSCACKRRSVRPLQQHFNRLALWVLKKKIIWNLGAILYKTILIKKKKQQNITYTFKHTHTNNLCIRSHKHAILRVIIIIVAFIAPMDRLLSLWNVKVHEVRLENKQNKKKTEKTSPVSFHTSTICLYKKIVFCTWAGLRHANFNFKQE